MSPISPFFTFTSAEYWTKIGPKLVVMSQILFIDMCLILTFSIRIKTLSTFHLKTTCVTSEAQLSN